MNLKFIFALVALASSAIDAAPASALLKHLPLFGAEVILHGISLAFTPKDSIITLSKEEKGGVIAAEMLLSLVAPAIGFPISVILTIVGFLFKDPNRERKFDINLYKQARESHDSAAISTDENKRPTFDDYYMFQDYDFNDKGTYAGGGFEGKSTEECKAICDGDHKCAGFQYNEKDKRKRCWMHSSMRLGNEIQYYTDKKHSDFWLGTRVAYEKKTEQLSLPGYVPNRGQDLRYKYDYEDKIVLEDAEYRGPGSVLSVLQCAAACNKIACFGFAHSNDNKCFVKFSSTAKTIDFLYDINRVHDKETGYKEIKFDEDANVILFTRIWEPKPNEVESEVVDGYNYWQFDYIYNKEQEPVYFSQVLDIDAAGKHRSDCADICMKDKVCASFTLDPVAGDDKKTTCSLRLTQRQGVKFMHGKGVWMKLDAKKENDEILANGFDHLRGVKLPGDLAEPDYKGVSIEDCAVECTKDGGFMYRARDKACFIVRNRIDPNTTKPEENTEFILFWREI